MFDISKAPCRGLTNTFFNERNKRKVYEAKQICSTCEFKKECGDWAIHNHVLFGIWGGMDRKEIAIQRDLQNVVLPPHYSTSGFTKWGR